MAFKIEFSIAAKEELDEAFAWLAKESPGDKHAK
jgi:hypothetical protein